MVYKYRETIVRLDGYEIYIYSSAPSPIYPFWHKVIAALVIYEFTKYKLHITFLDCLSLVGGKKIKTFKRR